MKRTIIISSWLLLIVLQGTAQINIINNNPIPLWKDYIQNKKIITSYYGPSYQAVSVIDPNINIQNGLLLANFDRNRPSSCFSGILKNTVIGSYFVDSPDTSYFRIYTLNFNTSKYHSKLISFKNILDLKDTVHIFPYIENATQINNTIYYYFNTENLHFYCILQSDTNLNIKSITRHEIGLENKYLIKCNNNTKWTIAAYNSFERFADSTSLISYFSDSVQNIQYYTLSNFDIMDLFYHPHTKNTIVQAYDLAENKLVLFVFDSILNPTRAFKFNNLVSFPRSSILSLTNNGFTDSLGNIYFSAAIDGISTINIKLDSDFKLQWNKIVPGSSYFMNYSFDKLFLSVSLYTLLYPRKYIVPIDRNGKSPIPYDEACDLQISEDNSLLDRIQKYKSGFPVESIQYDSLETYYDMQNKNIYTRDTTINIPKTTFSFNSVADICSENCFVPEYTASGIIHKIDFYLNNSVLTSDTICPGLSGINDLKAIYYYNGGCIDSAKVDFNVKESPVLNLPDSLIQCQQNDPITISSPLRSGENILWDDGTHDSIRTVNQPGIYAATLEKDGCTDTDTAFVWFAGSGQDHWPDIIDKKGNRILCPEESITVHVLNPDFWDEFEWQNTGTHENELTCYPPAVIPIQAKYHECVYSDTLFLSEKNCTKAKIFIPNTFSPNHDGLNDELNITGINIQVLTISIYNRWGAQVFNAKNNNSWNGYFNGKIVDNGIYVCIVEYLDILQNKTFRIAQDVAVIR